jgi:RimJ/RimL family protein N-acetyltransferase
MITTERLQFRSWRESDRIPFAKMNADPEVMKFFPKLNTEEESNALVDRPMRFDAENGFTYWAAEIPGVAEFAGFIGLIRPRYEAYFTPCVEISWRLAAEIHGKGYATEGAKAAIQFGFHELKQPEIYACTVPANKNSWRMMEKIGMSKVGGFGHPLVEDGSPRKQHVLYRILNR